MARRRLTVQGRGQDARVNVFVEVCRGKLWLTSFGSLFTVEAIFEPTQADRLVELVNQATKDARGYKNGPGS